GFPDAARRRRGAAWPGRHLRACRRRRASAGSRAAPGASARRDPRHRAAARPRLAGAGRSRGCPRRAGARLARRGRYMLTLMNSLARQAGRRSDVIVASFLLLAVAMMIVPLPTQAVDVLVSLNIAFAVLILVVAFYSARAVDFSVLPPVILLSTLFRLSLSITTTRLILKDADAGRIVAAFGEFVIAGDVVVGLVVFLIITVAPFVVKIGRAA